MGMTTSTRKNQFRGITFRTRLILTTLVIVFLAVAGMGVYSYYRAQQTDLYLTRQLDDSVRAQAEINLQKNSVTEVQTLNNFFLSLRKEITSQGAAAANMLNNATSLNGGVYWNAVDKLTRLPNGNWDNPNSDKLSVFVPGKEEITTTLASELNTLVQMDFTVPVILEDNPDTVAVYFGGLKGETLYYPNVDLSALVSTDFSAAERPWFIKASPAENPSKGPVWSEPYLDAAANGLIITTSSPVYDAAGKFRGVQAMDIQLNRISEIVSNIKVGETGHGFLLDKDKRMIAMSDAAYTDFGITADLYPLGNILDQDVLYTKTSPDLAAAVDKMGTGASGLETIKINGVENFIIYSPVPEVGYSLAIVVPSQELLGGAAVAKQQIAQSTQNSLLLAGLLVAVILALSTAAALVVGNRLVRPLGALTSVAQEITDGNLNAEAKVSGQDEIGLLASTFNSMTAQLRESIGTLEQHVAERTQSLELAAEVGRSVSQVRSLDVMLKDAAELIRSRFNLYYVQVYLADHSQNSLVLKSGTGEVGAELIGRDHRLPLQANSINGRAAVEKRSIVVADTAASATFKPNPLLPDTRSEMSVPLLVNEKVVGVLDLQSSEPDALNTDVLTAFEALAGQLAIAIQNAEFLAETQQARSEVEAQAQRLTRGRWAEYLDAVHKPESIAFAFDGEQVTPLAESEIPARAEDEEALVAPIAVTGETLGNLVVELKGESPVARAEDLVQNVARQVAQQIENLRLLETAERSRAEAEKASRRITGEGWKDFMTITGRESVGFHYNLTDVAPITVDAGQVASEGDVSLPIKVREEPIGTLTVQNLANQDSQSVELINSVAQRLGAHIESLRQQVQTRSALDQTEKLSAANLRLAQATDLDDMLRIIHETVVIPAVNRIRLGVFHYNESNELEDLVIVASWWDGSGHPPSESGQRYSAKMLDAVPYLTSPVPVFSGDTFHDERVNQFAQQTFAAQNIRALALMPLFIAGRQIGVLLLESEGVNNFSASDTRLLTAMAPQVATVVENRLQFERAQKQAERQSTLNVISQKIQSATSVEAVLQIAARELGHALGAPLTIAQLSIKDKK